MIRMKAPKGSGGASFGGEFYEADEKGIVEVPGEAVGELEAHGFKVDDGTEDAADEERLKNEQLRQLAEAVKTAKKALKEDPENEAKKADLDDAVVALTDAKKLA